METILIIGALCAILNFFIAQSRGANPVVWAIVGLCFNIVGVIACAILAKKAA